MAQEKVTAVLTAHRISKLKEDEKLNKDGKYDFLPDQDISATIMYDFGDDPQDAVDRFGKDVVMSFIEGHCLFGLQEKIRSLLQQGLSEEEIQEKIYDVDNEEYIWKPGLAPARKSTIEKLADKLNSLDPDEKERQRKILQAMLDKME